MAKTIEQKRIVAELWLKGQCSQKKLNKVLRDKEIKDITFGKRWVEDAIK